jgi:hypothetical protein
LFDLRETVDWMIKSEMFVFFASRNSAGQVPKKRTPEFRCARRGRQKGQANPIAPRILPGQRTTIRTINSLMLFDHSLSLKALPLQLIV